MHEECHYLVQPFDFSLTLVALFFQVGYFVALGERLSKEACNLFGEGFHFLCLLERGEFGSIPPCSQLFPGLESIFQVPLYLLFLEAGGSEPVPQSFGLRNC